MKVVVPHVSPEKSTGGSNPFQRLALHSAVAAALLGGGYGRAAYAGSCTPGPLSVCSGPANNGVDTTQNLSGTSLTVTTNAGFGIDTNSTGGGALKLLSTGGLTIDDTHNSTVAGGDFGIYATNFDSGALSITSTGKVTGSSSNGISATNFGTDLILKTVTVTGDSRGLNARNYGSGTLSVTSVGLVQGTNDRGIYAKNYGTDLILQTAGVTSGYDAISARNLGSGALSITSSAAVTGRHAGISAVNFGSGGLSIVSSEAVTASSTTGVGIGANNRGTNLTIQATSAVGALGIWALNSSGSLSITSNGAVTGTDSGGVVAQNHGTHLSIQTAEVTGQNGGVSAINNGSGALSITSSGVVRSNRGSAIYAENRGTDLTLQSVTATGGYSGIDARNFGSGALSISTSGEVTGRSRSGVVAANFGTDLILNAETVTGESFGISIFQHGEGTLSITTDGVVTGGSGNAMWLTGIVDRTTDGAITNNGGLVSNQTAAVLMTGSLNFEGDFNNHADITGGNGTAFDASATTNGIILNQFAGTITGNVLLGSGDDRLSITGGSINGRIVGQGFGAVIIDVGEGNAFGSNGVVDVADYVIQSGTVHQMADFSTAATTTTIANSATLSFGSVIQGGGALVSNGDLEFVLSPDGKGELIQAGTVTLNAGSTISVNASVLSPTLNESFRLISATGIVDNGVVLAEDAFGTLLYDFTPLVSSDSLSVLTTVADLGAVSPLQNPSAFGDSMTAFVNGGGDNAVVDLLADLGTGDVQGFEQVADVFSPSVSGAVSQGAREANDSTWRLINERLVGSATAFHNSEPPNGLWLQGYGGTTDQDAIDHVAGFDADTSGVAVGYDLELHQWRVGAAFSAGETNIDNDRFASDSIDIESNQLIVYGGFRQDQWFANATASAAALDYDFKRNNMIAGEGPIESDTDGDLLGMSVGGGYQYTMSDHVVLAPQLSLRYTTLDVDDYSEDGGLDLRVKYDDLDTLASELGVSASARFGTGDWQLAPTARLAWVHEYLDENEKATARYAGQSYLQEGFEPDQDFASVGLGMQASNEQGVSISLDYRGAFGSDYSSNQGWLSVRYEF